jgi:hypothetical protein
MYSKSNGEDDEEKLTNIKSINSRLLKLEKKLDYLIHKEKFDEIKEKDIPYFFLNKKNSYKNTDTAEKNSLLINILTANLWRKLYMQKSEEGFTLNDLIQPGLDNINHFSGLVSHSKDCYFSFDELLIQAAQNFHRRNLYLTKYEKENYNVLLGLLNNMDYLLSKIIHEIKINTNRNFDNYVFSGKIKRNERREISNEIKKTIEKIHKDIYNNNEDNNNQYENEVEVKNEKNEKGIFIDFDLIKNFGYEKENGKNPEIFLNNKNPFFSSCGFYRDFPDGRIFYTNKNKSITILSNVEDHIKFVLKAEEDIENNNFDIKNLQEYFEFLNKTTEAINFSYDSNLGYLNSLIENLGISFI